MQTRSLMTAWLAVHAFLCSCRHPGPQADAQKAPVSAHWSYEGSTGPEHWGSLAPEFALCATGMNQSPIDIRDTSSADLQNLDLQYAATALDIANNGHTVQVSYAPGSFMMVDGDRYDLQQFHFHSPSEHTVAGKHAEGEMHLVHRSATGGLAVVGVFLEEGVHNHSFDAIWEKLPSEGIEQRFDLEIRAADLLPSDPRTYRYSGSLTTPPGTEGVRWHILVEPVYLSASQLASLSEVMSGNNRPTQPLNGRTVLLDSSR